ncbi:hypothetical protein FRC08_013927 [Ceratobasidium sp. 394]|nr:hypothetical protein FRC08_013927 [Ceratobasidium sp. 394]
MNNRSSARRLFELPELLRLICKSLGDEPLSNLLYVSRAFFRAAAPLVWEDVAGAHHLLKLIPGTIVRHEKNDSDRLIVVIDIPHGLGKTTDFVRFNLYAQFVKRLDVLPPDISDYRIDGWRYLSKQAQQRVLLPNLRELTIAGFLPGGEKLFLWIRMFLSPSLISIVVKTEDGEFPTVPLSAAKSLLEQIKATCSGLQHLQIFAGTVSRDHSFVDFWEPSFYERLAGLQLRK